MKDIERRQTQLNEIVICVAVFIGVLFAILDWSEYSKH